MELLTYNFQDNLQIQLPTIDQNTNFWMIRTEQGLFYEEFLSGQFIALRWNEIDSNFLKSIKATKDDEKRAKEFIQERYTDIKRGGSVLSKCRKFVYEINEGDILMIPGKTDIAFGIAGEYYESDDTAENEDEFLLNREFYLDLDSYECPYKKRRTIELIKRVPHSKINPNLYKALISYHGINDLWDYRGFVLQAMYEVYYYENQLAITFEITQEKGIDAIDFADFIGSTAETIRTFCPGEVHSRMNLNSPGDLTFLVEISEALVASANILMPVLEEHLTSLCALWIMLKGGSIKKGDFEFQLNGLLERSKIKEEYHESILQKLIQLAKNMTRGKKSLKISDSTFENVINLDDHRDK